MFVMGVHVMHVYAEAGLCVEVSMATHRPP